MTAALRDGLAKHPEVFTLHEGFDIDSPELVLIERCGDCLDRVPVHYAWADRSLSGRDGDRVLIEQIGAPPGVPHLAKYLLRVDGVDWFAAKNHAMKRLESQHRIIGRIVCEFHNPNLPTSEDVEAARLRANPPDHPYVVVFPADIFDVSKIREAIRAHMARWEPLHHGTVESLLRRVPA